MGFFTQTKTIATKLFQPIDEFFRKCYQSIEIALSLYCCPEKKNNNYLLFKVC